MTAHPFKTLLSNANFRKLWASQLLSQLTINLVNFMVLARVFEATRSTTAISLLWMSYSLPVLFFAPFSGSIVDAVSRRQMLVVTNLLQAAVVSLYLFLPLSKVYTLFVLVFLYSFLDQLYLPSQQASLPALVDKKILPAANSIFLLTQQASFFVGFGLGGLVLTALGFSGTTILSTAFLLLAALAIFLLPKDAPRKDKIVSDLGLWIGNFKKSWGFVSSHRPVLYPLLTIGFTQMLITLLSVLLPSFVYNVLNLDIKHASLVFIAPAAIGALAFTYFLPRILRNRRKKDLIQTGFLTAAAGLFLLSQVVVMPAFRLLSSTLVALLLGVSFAAIMIPCQSLLQEHTPPWFRGRVYSSLSFFLLLATSVPLMISSALADLFGVSTLFALLATLLLVIFYLLSQKGDYVLANGLGV